MRRPVYDGVTVPVSFDDAVAVLAGPPDTWLPPPARRGAAGHVVVLPATDVLGRREVVLTVDVGDLHLALAGLAVRRVACRGTPHEPSLPRLVGDLELAAFGQQSSRLTMVGGYAPPVSVVGGTYDVLLAHRVAEHVVRCFLEAVAARLAEVPSIPGGSP